jgi:hypothetical protein
MLPHSCHHFPRRALSDSRGTFVSLSHFCPTAAALLVDGDHLDLVRSPAAFPSSREYEGLDARGEWPPLLRPDVLMDERTYEVWERFLIATLGSSTDDAGTALLRVAAAAEALRGWSVAQGDFAAWTRQTLVDRRTATAADLDAARRRYRRFGSDEAFEIVCDTIPDGLPRPAPPLPLADDVASFESEWQRQGATACRYLGTRAFASWTAYQASGLRTQVAELFAAAAVLRVECLRQWQQRHALDRAAMIEAVRSADWLLVHLVDRSRLLSWLGEAER